MFISGYTEQLRNRMLIFPSMLERNLLPGHGQGSNWVFPVGFSFRYGSVFGRPESDRHRVAYLNLKNRQSTW
jgi:hypothetical protein